MKRKFYHGGLRFECTGCGDCCTYSDASVFVTSEEIIDISRYLSLSPEETIHQFTEDDETRMTLKNKGDACIFLLNDRCRIYPVRPSQCRTFPFWPEIMKSGIRWEYVRAECEGIGKGRIFTRDEIRLIMKGENEAAGFDPENPSFCEK